MTSPRSSGAPSFEALLGRDDIVWMGQNTTHLEPAPEVVAALEEATARHEFSVYAPAGGFAELRERIVDDLRGPGSTLPLDAWVTDGAVGGLHHICTTLAPKLSQIIVSDPGWPWPARFVSLSGVPIRVLSVYDQSTHLMQAEQIAEVISPNSLIYLIDPLNPLGSSYTRPELEAIVALARETGSTIIHDCTYRHFADGHSLAAELYPEGTFSTYSFSKWLGLAGLRVGAIVADPELLSTVTAVPANPLGAGILGQRAALAGLRVKDSWLQNLRATNRANLERVEQIVDASGLGSVIVSPSQGNFLAVDLGASGWSADALCDSMLEDGVFIRPGTYQSPLHGERFVKVSTSVPPEWIERFGEVWNDRAAWGSGA
ncbi:aminotransferase class I/II-fold pyridoxal phosphate-dependent enzyme [Herbiconiux moechotypicola]|uniref:Aminotransferase n=1 Tax=Herbiconiux moechotypicola TaxID=637393 RepID=A0ABP5R225_9MICO|nr:aminotransferase class I/II-fold pyridoxal phosphate-dependent enzyme [Herbiconiux moechotypicola]MCS5731576.1 aminotransferase class I/II-fold pyridoxal phosphate-dependent enzyme [Herbiconiux moechotypicola]